jgi:hypothetical protein
MNDVIKAVVLDDEDKAKKLMEIRANKYYVRNKFAYSDYKAYRFQCYWHIHDIEITEV